MQDMNIKELAGKTLADVIFSDDNKKVTLVGDDGKEYAMLHQPVDREHVSLYGRPLNTADMVGEPLILARMDVQDKTPADLLTAGFYCDNSYTWTVFTFATSKGVVVFRWLGTSTGGGNEVAAFIEG